MDFSSFDGWYILTDCKSVNYFCMVEMMKMAEHIFFLQISRSEWFFSNLNYHCPNFLDLINLQEQVEKAFCDQKLFWAFTANFSNSPPSASNFKSFSRSLEQFFLTVGQNNFGNKILFLFLLYSLIKWSSTLNV